MRRYGCCAACVSGLAVRLVALPNCRTRHSFDPHQAAGAIPQPAGQGLSCCTEWLRRQAREAQLNRQTDYVGPNEPDSDPAESGARPVVVNRIKQALVTSRLTFGNQNTGTNPYDSGREDHPGQVWGNRLR